MKLILAALLLVFSISLGAQTTTQVTGVPFKSIVPTNTNPATGQQPVLLACIPSSGKWACQPVTITGGTISGTTLTIPPGATGAAGPAGTPGATGPQGPPGSAAAWFSEVPQGTADGTNAKFTLSYPVCSTTQTSACFLQNSQLLLLNGLFMFPAFGDYTISGNTITFGSSQIPPAGSNIAIVYQHN